MHKLKFLFAQRNLSHVAFTLAEVLITLGIIGIVAAMTIPTLINNTQNAEFVTGLKKAYSIISQATERVQQDQGDYSNWGIKDDYSSGKINEIFELYKPYFNIIKDCGNDGNDGCWALTNGMNGDAAVYSYSYGIGEGIRVFTLSDGMNVALDGWGATDPTLGVNNVDNYIGFCVDVNGNKKPNKIGHDVFFIVVNAKGTVVPAGINDNSENCVTTNHSNIAGYDCAAKVLREGKIDY